METTRLISTHAPRTGGATGKYYLPLVGALFQPTLPARGATVHYMGVAETEGISTHAPRTGSDFPSLLAFSNIAHFNPRSPHGERPGSEQNKQWLKEFQPTLPARGATYLQRMR